MDFADLDQKTVTELHEMLDAARDELRVLRFQVSERQLKKMHTIKQKRKLIARISMKLDSKKANTVRATDSK
jgi:ribosomal protein L29